MTSTLLQQQQLPQPHYQKQKQKQLTIETTTRAKMAWSTDKIRFSCVDNISLKQLWRLIALDTVRAQAAAAAATAKTVTSNNNNCNVIENQCIEQQEQQMQEQMECNNNNNNTNEQQNNLKNCENLAEELLINRDILSPTSRMSLLKFLAINALELSAPATPALLQHNQANQNGECKPKGWVQLSGHPQSIVPTTSGIVRKRVANFTDNEVLAYQFISTHEPQTAKIVPKFYGTLQQENEHFIELQDLLSSFKDPCVMDIKMGCRTFLESEVTNTTLRSDLYKKMIAVDSNAPTIEEHEAQAITKLRYMLFRESMSSSQDKGFRIEALRMRGRQPINDLKTVRSGEEIAFTIEQFLEHKRSIHKELIKRLKHMRNVMEKSTFFQHNEIVGSSIFIVYDDEHVGAWLIDFAKSRQLPSNMKVNHRSDWIPGNREEGLLRGMDELIEAFEAVYVAHTTSKCL